MRPPLPPIAMPGAMPNAAPPLPPMGVGGLPGNPLQATAFPPMASGLMPSGPGFATPGPMLGYGNAAAPGADLSQPGDWQQFDLLQQPTFLNEEICRRYASLDPGVWARRDTRMLRHRRLYELIKPPKNKLKPGQKPSVTTDAKAIVHKFAGMFANHPPAISCVSEDPQQQIAAERCADFLRTFRRRENKRYGRGPHGTRPYDEAIYAVRDGTIVDMILWDPREPSFPYQTFLVDPMTVYVTYDTENGEQVKRVTWKYRTTIAEAKQLCDRYDRKDIIPDSQTGAFRQDSLPLEVSKVVTNEGGNWELGILIRNTWVVTVPLGYNPFVVTHVNARIYSSTVVGELTNMDRYENVGVGVFDIIEEAIKAKNEDYTVLREMMHRDANPPRVIFTNDEGKLDELKFEPGQNIHLWADDKFQLVPLTPDFRKLEALMSMDQASISRGTVPDLIWGEGGNSSSAAEYMALGNARDQIFVFKAALEEHYMAKYELVLDLYKRFSSAIMPGYGTPATFQQTNPTTGVKLGGQPFTVQDILALGPEPDVCVEYSDITPQNEMARAQMAATLTDKKIIDLQTARQIGVPAPYNEQPMLMGQRVLSDISLMSPVMTQIMSMTAALYSPDPVQRTIAQMMLPSLEQQAQMQAMGGGQNGQPGPNGGANPRPGQNGVPSSNKQMNPQANPAESGNHAGLAEGQNPAPQQASQPGQPS